MSKNIGKIFEESIKSSVPDYALLIRLPDPPQAFTQRSDTRFSRQNPCDYICFDTSKRVLYFWDLKTTHNKSISFEDVNSDKKQIRMIHAHQILGLKKYSEYKAVCAGFIFNFRDEKNDIQRTYFQSIIDFERMAKEINKFSCNEMDILMYNAKKIQGIKKRTRYTWDIDGFLRNME